MKGREHTIPSTVFPTNNNLAVLGHELGNVLNGILGMAELLGDSGLNAEQDRWLKAIENSGRQMESLIRSVWAVQEEGDRTVAQHPVRVDGMEILEHVVTSHTPAASLRNNQLLLVAYPDLPRYWRLDACLVRQLLDNLVGNAIKFTLKGEVIIEAASVGDAGDQGRAIRLRVSDTGPGFDVARSEHLFSAYHPNSAPAEAGTGNRGLGLYICRKIVLALGGNIRCSIPKKGGSRFEVVLPGAFCSDKGRPLGLQSTLFGRIRCQLNLEKAFYRSVGNFLSRLGVPFGEAEAVPPRGGLSLIISEAPHDWAKAPPSLLFTPHTNSTFKPRQRILQAPLLESSLGSLLLEIALEWRSLVLRNESPDSVPRLR